MLEANLYPVIPHLHFDGQIREMTSMSDFVHTARPPELSAESRTFEPRLLFGACYVLFLSRAVVRRLVPRRGEEFSRKVGRRESIFKEAWNAASVAVGSSFMGL
jgi:hypothetical protein